MSINYTHDPEGLNSVQVLDSMAELWAYHFDDIGRPTDPEHSDAYRIKYFNRCYTVLRDRIDPTRIRKEPTMPDRTSLTTLADDAHLLALYRQALKEYNAPGALEMPSHIYTATLEAIEEAEAKAGLPPDQKVHRLCDEVEQAFAGALTSECRAIIARFRALAGPIDWEQRGKELAKAVEAVTGSISGQEYIDLLNALERFNGNRP